MLYRFVVVGILILPKKEVFVVSSNRFFSFFVFSISQIKQTATKD